MIQKDMYGNFKWSSKPKLMLQSFSFFDDSEEVKTHVPEPEVEDHKNIIKKAKEKYCLAKIKLKGLLHKETH